jgi:hypothetical protein
MKKLSIAFAIFAKYFEKYDLPISNLSVAPQKIYVELTYSLLSDEDYFTLLECGFTHDNKTWVWIEYANEE